ncbi:MAG: L,D-transpeptidase family protein [Pseudomonadota bacterium]
MVPAHRWAAALLAAAMLLAGGCAPAAPPRAAPDSEEGPTSETRPGAFAALLMANGIDAGIPSRGRFVLVNVPSFELVALQDGDVVLRSRVIVGRPATPTPTLVTPLHAVKFNPSWTPTPAMVRYEGLRYMPPGPNNPLGRILFELDNDELVFLHDTNQRQLFQRAERALSHGCVRVEQARALAAWVLGVSTAEIDASIARGVTFTVPVPVPIPVSLAYFTRFPDEQGQLASYPDLYGRGGVAQRGVTDPNGCAEARPTAAQNLEKRLVKP